MSGEEYKSCNGTALSIVLHLYMYGNLLCLQQPNYGDRLDELNVINFMFHCILCYFCVKFAMCVKEHVTLNACCNGCVVQCSLRCWISGFLHHMLCCVCYDILVETCWGLLQDYWIWFRWMLKHCTWYTNPEYCHLSNACDNNQKTCKNVSCLDPASCVVCCQHCRTLYSAVSFVICVDQWQSLVAARMFTRTYTAGVEDICLRMIFCYQLQLFTLMN